MIIVNSNIFLFQLADDSYDSNIEPDMIPEPFSCISRPCILPFPPDQDIKRLKCKRKDLEYWVSREEHLDDEENIIVNFYASADDSFKELTIEGPFGGDTTQFDKTRRKYIKEIAWVQCTPGFINEVRYRRKKPLKENTWFDGCGVTIELVKLCLQDKTLNKATPDVIRKQLRDDLKWKDAAKKETMRTMTRTIYRKWEETMFEPNQVNALKLNEDFCSNLIGFIPSVRLLEKDEDNGLKNILIAADEAGTVNKMLIKYFDTEIFRTTFGSYGLIKDALKGYKKGKIDKTSIVANEEDEKNGVTGKIFFCMAGSDFDKR